MVSQVLPKEVDTFDFVDGVWITSPRTVVPVAIALRQVLLEVALMRQAGEGQQTKMELVYQYLTGPRFRQRVQATLEKLDNLREDLDKERKFLQKQWAKREEQIQCAAAATLGMFGDFQGIAGQTLQEIEGLTDETDPASPVKRLGESDSRRVDEAETGVLDRARP
jgi:hypothetical protein